MLKTFAFIITCLVPRCGLVALSIRVLAGSHSCNNSCYMYIVNNYTHIIILLIFIVLDVYLGYHAVSPAGLHFWHLGRACLCWAGCHQACCLQAGCLQACCLQAGCFRAGFQWAGCLRAGCPPSSGSSEAVPLLFFL